MFFSYLIHRFAVPLPLISATPPPLRGTSPYTGEAQAQGHGPVFSRENISGEAIGILRISPSSELGSSQRAETYPPKGLMFPKASKVGDGYSIIPSDAGSFRGEFRLMAFDSEPPLCKGRCPGGAEGLQR